MDERVHPPVRVVLIITDIFPPLAGAGVKRILKFAKFLPEYGWSPVVLTADNESFLPLDSSLTAEIPPGTSVFRTYTMESLFQSNNNRDQGHGSPAAHAEPRAGRSKASGFSHGVYKALGQFLKVPDSRILWLPWAVLNGVRICRKKRVDVVMATGPSFTNFLIGGLVKRLAAKPLLLDVRDAWLADPTRVFPKSYLRWIDSRCERFALNSADRVITTNPSVTRDFAERYSRYPAKVFDTVYNGYDRDDFALLSSTPQASFDKFAIIHTGRLYAERTPRYFLKALGLALKKNPEMRHRARVVFVGSCETFADGKCVQDYVNEFELGNVVELAGRVSRRQSLEFQMQANLLLLLIGIVPSAQAMTYGISGKLFDYMCWQKPIVTLANDGATRDLITRHRLGHVFSHEETEALSNHLVTAFQQHLIGQQATVPRPESFAQFDFRLLSGKLAGHLARMIEH
jgi:glycosyltransferase involved in cell wall biosynthesis